MEKLTEKKLKITYEASSVDVALDKELERAINHLCKGWDFIGSGYDFETQTRDLEFRALKDF
ncbi:hypothetical protein IID22_02095 [Patescibacteria group bacterium]|nr:hypothetical protein [Patescibacteria group bacterium]